MAFSLYLDGECLSTSCTYVEYTSGELQYNDSNGTNSKFVKVYMNNDSSDFVYEGPDDLYLTTTYNPGSGSTGSTGSTGNTDGDDTPMVVTFNYYVNGVLVDDTTFEAIEMDMGRPIDEIWPRTLECYHIRFDKINPVEPIEVSSPGTSSNTSYNSLEFTYIYENKFNENELVNNWPYTGTLNNTKTIQAFSNTYFSGENCVTINGIGYKAGEDFTENPIPIFHSNNTKTLEVNLYYTAVQVSTIVRTYNRDSSIYNIEETINDNASLNKDLWGYTSVGINNINHSNYTYHKILYDVPLTSGNEVICYASYKPGFKFVKWVLTSEVEEIHETYKNAEDRKSEIDKLPALKDETGAENDRDAGAQLNLNAYTSHDVTAIFEGVKNEVKLYKGLDFYGSDTYYIWGGDKQWKNSVNSDTYITIPTREGAKLLGWVEYEQNDDSLDYPTIPRSEYTDIIELFNKTEEEAFDTICNSIGKIKKGVIRIDNFEDNGKPVLLSGVDGYTDSQGNWLTGNTSLYPLWLVEEYPITYVSAGYNKLYVDETDIDEENGLEYTLSPSDYGLPLTYTILGENADGKDIVFKALEKQGDKAFPEYKRFDRWEPSEIKKFSKTGPQTITAYWVLDTYKITLEKNNNYANQSVKIQIGQSTFDKGINNPTTRTAYKSFEGWYTENNIHTNNGCDIIGKLIINKEGILQPSVEGYTDSEGKWIKEENTTVYAKWTPEEYIITYHLINNEGNEEDIERKYTIEDTKIKITNSGSAYFFKVLENGLPLLDNTELNPPTGYSLDGWYTNKNCTGTRLKYLEKGSTGDKTFYGRYKTAEYDIVYYNIEGCTNKEDLPAKHVYGSKTDLIKPILPLYKFLDWCTDENFENTITSIPADYTGDSTIKLYAKKIPEIISISYKDSNGNDLTEASSFNSTPPIQYDYENGTELVKAHKNGYDFDGWYDNPECTGKSFMSLDAKKYTTAVILYCKFIPISYSITYYVDGDVNTNTGNPSSYTIEELPIELNNPQDKLGYNSIGWRTGSSSSTDVVDKIKIDSIEDLNLYWVWEPNTVTITWDANGGSVTPASTRYTYNGDTVQLPSPTRDGYVFDGWYTSPTGGTKINDVGVNNKPTEDITYYALWHNNAEAKCTLIHKKQALDGTYPESLYETAVLLLMVGHNITFGVQEYTGFTSPPKQSAIIAADGSTVVEYYYTRNKYTISWDANGGEELTGDYTNGSVYFETPIVKPNNPIKEGYVFSGWSPSIPETMPANDIVFVASYIEEKTNLVSEIIDTELETVTNGKIATDKWINNAIGEPEKTIFEHLGNFFNTTFGNNITGECVTGNDLENFFSTELNKCIKQSQFIEIFSNSENVSNGYIVEKNFTFSISSNNESNLEFTVTIPESEESIPNYPNTTGFIMYYTLGSNPTLYKTYVPINKSCHFSLENTSDSIVIHRIPLYYLDSMNTCILPKITIQNNTNRIVGDTLITSQIIE